MVLEIPLVRIGTILLTEHFPVPKLAFQKAEPEPSGALQLHIIPPVNGHTFAGMVVALSDVVPPASWKIQGLSRLHSDPDWHTSQRGSLVWIDQRRPRDFVIRILVRPED